jgi:hypothetical protein
MGPLPPVLLQPCSSCVQVPRFGKRGNLEKISSPSLGAEELLTLSRFCYNATSPTIPERARRAR